MLKPQGKIIKVSANNILFKSHNEQFQIIEHFGKLLNSITIPFQILCTSEELVAEDWKLKIFDEKYYNFIREKIYKNEITTKQFRIVVNHEDSETVDNTIKIIKRSLRECRLEFEGIEEIPDSNILPYMKPDYVKIDDYYYKTLAVKTWPYQGSYGWLSDIYNNEKNIDISMFIYNVPKVDALKYLNKKLAQNVSNSVIDGEDDEMNEDQYDESILSAMRMREDLYQNNGKFFFMSYYITVKSKSLSQLKKDYEYIKTVLEGMDIEISSCYLRQDDAYKCTRPFGINYLDNKYNFTTNPLKYFFPFISSNIIDRDGVLIGENLLNSGLIFLNPFRYSSGLMFILGKVGSGKTFLTQLFIKRLIGMKVKVDIFDKTGEYLPLLELINSPYLTIHHYKMKHQYKTVLTNYVQEMDKNLNILQPRFLFIDEFWEYLDDDEFAEMVDYIALTGRKKYQGLGVITQMIEHMLKNDKCMSILKNASIKAIMQMEPNEAREVQKELALTDEEVNFLVTAYQEGILFAGSRHVQFKAMASTEEEDTITTDPIKRAEKMRKVFNLEKEVVQNEFAQEAACSGPEE